MVLHSPGQHITSHIQSDQQRSQIRHPTEIFAELLRLALFKHFWLRLYLNRDETVILRTRVPSKSFCKFSMFYVTVTGCSLYHVFQWDTFFHRTVRHCFFLISVKHKIVFALQFISVTIFHRRGHS